MGTQMFMTPRYEKINEISMQTTEEIIIDQLKILAADRARLNAENATLRERLEKERQVFTAPNGSVITRPSAEVHWLVLDSVGKLRAELDDSRQRIAVLERLVAELPARFK